MRGNHDELHLPLVEIRLRTRSRLLEVAFGDGARFELPFEYLRVHSPSAEVQGHGPGQEVLVTGKENVAITAVEPVGHYAVRLVFDDGHDTGLYTWNTCANSARSSSRSGAHYLARVDAGQKERPGMSPAKSSQDPHSAVPLSATSRGDSRQLLRNCYSLDSKLILYCDAYKIMR